MKYIQPDHFKITLIILSHLSLNDYSDLNIMMVPELYLMSKFNRNSNETLRSLIVLEENFHRRSISNSYMLTRENKMYWLFLI